MRWEDERYVRLYNRDSATWAMLPWQGRCLLPLLLRKVDRAGLLEVVNGEEAQAVATLVNVPIEVVEVGLAALKTRGVVTIRGGELRLPTFLAAQTAKQSDKLRQEKSRELAALGKPLSHAVTSGHTPSHDVTPSLAVPSCAVPEEASVTEKKPRSPSVAEAFWSWAQAEALKKNPARVPDERKPKDLNTLLKTPLGAHGKLNLSRAWSAYLENKYGADAGWPLELFISKINELLNSKPNQTPQMVAL